MKKKTNISFDYLFILLLFFLVLSCTNYPVIYLVGDSTMSYKPDPENPERGWGMLLPEYFDTLITIENHAMNGRSSRSFIYEGRWDSVMNLLHKGDYVIIQFAHNDGGIHKVDRYCTPEEYRYNMTRFIFDTRSKGAEPVLCTSIQRRKFDSTGQVMDTHGVYPEITRELAKEYIVPLVDMQQLSNELIMEFGIEGSKKLFIHVAPGELAAFPDGKIDNTHFSETGARAMAGLFVEGLIKINHDLTKYLKAEKMKNKCHESN